MNYNGLVTLIVAKQESETTSRERVLKLVEVCLLRRVLSDSFHFRIVCSVSVCSFAHTPVLYAVPCSNLCVSVSMEARPYVDARVREQQTRVHTLVML